MGEKRFEFVQLPRDVQSELQTQENDTQELFQKWYMVGASFCNFSHPNPLQGSGRWDEICNISLQQALSGLPEGCLYTGRTSILSTFAVVHFSLNPQDFFQSLVVNSVLTVNG